MEIKYYENMLELHDNHTFWKLNNETAENISTNEFYNVINYLTEKYNNIFNKKFNTNLYGLGRSGRHICVENNDFNKRHYKSMKRYALKLEKDFVEDFNNINFLENT